MFLLINLRDSLFCGLISLLPYYHLWFNQLIALLPGDIYQRKSVFLHYWKMKYIKMMYINMKYIKMVYINMW